MNGFDFKPSIEKIYIDPIEFAMEINKAMNEEPVNDLIFVEALKELLPDCEYENYNLIARILLKKRPKEFVKDFLTSFEEVL